MLPNNVNFSFEFGGGRISADYAGYGRDLRIQRLRLHFGFPGSLSCSAGHRPCPMSWAHGSLRLTLSAETTKEEIDYTVDKIKEIVAKLRNMSPLYEDYAAGKTKSMIKG